MKEAVAAGCKSILMQVVLNESNNEVFMMNEKLTFFNLQHLEYSFCLSVSKKVIYLHLN